jgi:ABC-2 type transport system ATP-binding protein
MTNAIEFRGVERHFGAQEVLRGLSFSVAPGQVYALLGRNGAGKTTALRILLGFLRAHAGEARVLGLDSATLAPEERERIGYVSEGHKLYLEMRVETALDFEAGTRPRFDRAAARRELERCGIPPEKRIHALSRGQRAQLALVLAASGTPEVLIFDDPAMGLDVAMRRELLGSLIELLSSRGCAVLFSSHILSDVERIADRVGILHGGGLIVDAPLDELKRRIEKRHWVPRNGRTDRNMTDPGVAGLLRARAVEGGFELTLLDLDGPREAELRASAARVSERIDLDLEELFLELTTAPEASR